MKKLTKISILSETITAAYFTSPQSEGHEKGYESDAVNNFCHMSIEKYTDRQWRGGSFKLQE